MRKKKNIAATIFLTVLLIVSLSAILAIICISISNTNKENISSAINTTFLNIYNSFNENEVKANKDYKGKIIRVTGKVDKINQGVFDSFYIEMVESDNKANYTSDVYFKDIEKEKVTNIKKGDIITIVGKVVDIGGLGCIVLVKDAVIE